MDYKRIYDEFISDRVEKGVPEGYSERHHIIPKSVGGSDCSSNIVRLSPGDHLFAHMLLARIYNTRGLWFALITMMSLGGKSARGVCGNRRSYDEARRRYVEGLKKDNPLVGRKLSQSHRKRISENSPRLSGVMHPMFGRKHSSETKLKMSKSSPRLSGKDHPMYGKKQTDETICKMSRAQSGNSNNNADKSLHIFNKDGEEFVGTRYDFKKYTGITSGEISRLVNGKTRKTKGWSYNGAEKQ